MVNSVIWATQNVYVPLWLFVVGVESVPRNNSIKGSLKAKSQNKYENNSSTCKYSSTNWPAAKENYGKTRSCI